MFAGHVGAALVIGRTERCLNIGLVIFAALFLDIVLWLLVLLGWESATIPPDFSKTHQAQFIFPYSHGLLASCAWSVFVAGTVILCAPPLPERKLRCAVLVGAAVFSHWLLDALVHVPELPLLGAASTKVGLGLWRSLPIALFLEGLIVAVGIWLFVRCDSVTRARKLGLSALCVLLLAFTVAGMTVAPPAPSAAAMAASSLITLLAVCTLAFWLGRLPAAMKRPPYGQEKC